MAKGVFVLSGAGLVGSVPVRVTGASSDALTYFAGAALTNDTDHTAFNWGADDRAGGVVEDGDAGVPHHERDVARAAADVRGVGRRERHVRRR